MLVIFDDMSDQAPTEEIGFLLLPEFPIYALVLAVEALRVANQNAGRRLFATRLFTADGRPVVAGSGAELVPDSGIAEVKFCPTLLVVAGNQPTQHLTRGMLAWLRRLDRHGTLLGAVSPRQISGIARRPSEVHGLSRGQREREQSVPCGLETD